MPRGGKGNAPRGRTLELITCFAWICWTAIASTFFNNMFVHTFQDPLSHTIIRFIGASVYGIIWALLQGYPLPGNRTLKALLVPSIYLVSANQLNSMALQMGGPCLPYILKSAIPVFTVISLVFMGYRYVGQV